MKLKNDFILQELLNIRHFKLYAIKIRIQQELSFEYAIIFTSKIISEKKKLIGRILIAGGPLP